MARLSLAAFALVFAGLSPACAKKDAAVGPASSSRPVASMASAAPSASVAAAPPDGSAPAASWPDTLPKPTLPAPAAIAVDGYPAPVPTCLPDPAYLAGYSTDGALFGYCNKAMGTHCDFVDRAGVHHTDDAGGPDPKPGDARREIELDRSTRAMGVPEVPEKDCQKLPNPMKGAFRYGDIKLKVIELEGSVVKVGGSVGGGPAVFPFIYGKPTPSGSSNGTRLNVLALSPDGDELGMVTHTNCMEWCDIFEIVRLPVDTFASGVYNDAGFAAYKKNDLAKARELFLRAAYLDQARELPAYNLACVYAREHDHAHADAALSVAIIRGGEAVRKRAREDKDFAEYKEATWFKLLTQ